MSNKTLYQSMGNYDDFKGWLKNNKLTALGSTWLTAVTVSFVAQLPQNTPMTLKLFQTRIYAQAFTIAALCGAAAITITDEQNEKEKKSDDIFTR